MQLQVGMVVRACAGKEAGNFYLIVKQDANFVWLADGKHRTLQKPKRKNPKHVCSSSVQWSLDGLTDKALRQKLHLLKEGNKFV